MIFRQRITNPTARDVAVFDTATGAGTRVIPAGRTLFWNVSAEQARQLILNGYRPKAESSTVSGEAVLYLEDVVTETPKPTITGAQQ